MDWQQIAAAGGVLGGVLGAILGAAGKTWSDSKAVDKDQRANDQRANLDQLQLALATISKLEARADIQGGQIANLGKRIEDLLLSRAEILAENKQLRRDIGELQRQVVAMGAIPAVPMPDPIVVEGRVANLERRSVANADRIDAAETRSATNAAHIQSLEDNK